MTGGRDPYSALLDAQEANRRYRARVRDLEAALRALVATEPTGFSHDAEPQAVCPYCAGPPRRGWPAPGLYVEHTPGCPWLAARALLGEGAGERYCTTIGCARPAEYEVRTGPGVYAWTDLCAVCAAADGWTRDDLHRLGHERSLAEEDAPGGT